MHKDMEIIFYEIDPERAKAAQLALEGCYSCVCSGVADLPLNETGTALVTAGNSFGIMDGGVDAAVAERLSWCQHEVQAAICNDYAGELPVGCAVRAWSRSDAPVVIYAPTMQVPMSIQYTANVYYAMLAVLREARKSYRTRYGTRMVYIGQYDRACYVKRLYVPLMGCGTGGLTADASIAQMLAAIDQERQRACGKLPEGMNWDYASAMHARWHRLSGVCDSVADEQVFEEGMPMD